ncbi:Cof-type HAD-IIB family hydrolase [Companilactobacillus sp.]|jgi:Cof subfamily protein (haloacid dehalogenase superfamily)|uniref:Cof-type HAD-IIB family hydrolase n=1 Tax=Companilactobacillus sp. TaxID=2767905 RepID=UPI0025C3B5D4|nr:Cof-type HAD-IIB family hydrolase [Companilactobacillus sp.]MCH4010307.1 Cof-type HAD-IIB family hydrolase [Companilactobacillus sp.]MCH4052017.1 Cof-type HAD-IIB family hydrolase [Companilactobacillus sp.]MCH4078249.1 Cof-type HAD-IIB family hydrolase [Companilactobacillus sp.]MCH4126825.1 Cof-type HAD-IIB family hydrolase [Companilactobacillus sp.]MCH4132664.1 Cof-type HAD-IIB family hydrolase [Companilactobacillus sp.]
MDIKLVLSDIDGTILDDNNFVDSNLQTELRVLKQKNIPFVLSSARSPEGMLPIAKKLDIVDNPIASYNGAYIIKDIDLEYPTIISSHALPQNEIQNIFEIINQDFPTVSINLYSKSQWYVNQTDHWTDEEADITNIEPMVTDLNRFILDKPVHKLLLIDEPDVISDLMKQLQNAKFLRSTFILSKPNYLEITDKGASKSEALKELAEYYHLPIEDTMALGDNFNDVPMFETAGLGVAMENAPDEVKGMADEVTSSNNDNGVSEALKKYL